MKKIKKSISLMLSTIIILIMGISTNVKAATVTGQDVVNEAKKYIGVKYVWGGKDPSTGFDCSGFTSYVYKQLGITIPGWVDSGSSSQAGVGTKISNINDLQLGDLVITYNYGHVGIYVGNGQYINSPQPGDSVRIMPITNFNEGRRIVSQQSNWYGYITTDSTPYYASESNNDSLIRGYVNAGDVVVCYSREGNWYYTNKGYIYNTRIKDMPSRCNFTVDYDGAPYYSSPSNNDSLIVGRWKKGDQITIDYKEGNWYHTSAGWVYKTAVTPVFS